MSRSPPSTEATLGTAKRWTVPASEVVMGASIFMASMVATVWPGVDVVAYVDGQRHRPGKGSGNVGGVVRLGPLAPGRGVLHGAVPDRDHAGLAVEPAENGAETALVRLAYGVEGEVQGKAGVQGDLDLVPGAEAVEKGGRGQHGELPELAGGFFEILGGAGEKQRVEQVAQLRWTVPPGRSGRPWSRPAGRGRATGCFLPARALVRKGSGHPPAGTPSSPGKEPDNAVGQVEAGRVALELDDVGVGAAQVQSEVADHLGARRHFHDVAEDPVGLGVQVLHHFVAVAQPQGDRLLAEVGYLAPRHLVAVDAVSWARPG